VRTLGANCSSISSGVGCRLWFSSSRLPMVRSDSGSGRRGMAADPRPALLGCTIPRTSSSLGVRFEDEALRPMMPKRRCSKLVSLHGSDEPAEDRRRLVHERRSGKFGKQTWEKFSSAWARSPKRESRTAAGNKETVTRISSGSDSTNPKSVKEVQWALLTPALREFKSQQSTHASLNMHLS
jgi:hypothetical protein